MGVKRNIPMTAELARSLWDYDPLTGILRWRVAPAAHLKAGAIAGSRKAGLYLYVGYAYRVYAVHRIAWLIVTGEWPQPFLDHRDTDKVNNRWRNLRLATRGQNNDNVGLRKDNTSGIKGVSYQSTGHYRKRWCAAISHNRRSHWIGRYHTKEEAAAAYAAEAARLKGEFARPCFGE